MRHFPKVLVTLIASAALLVPAALAGADSQAASKSVATSVDCIALLCNFSILNDNDVEVLNNLNVAAVINVCPSIQVVELNLLAVGDVIWCSGSTNPGYKKIKRNS